MNNVNTDITTSLVKVRIEEFEFKKDGLSRVDYWFYGREGEDFVYYEDKLFIKTDKILLKNLKTKPEIYTTPITHIIDKIYPPRSRQALSNLVSSVKQIKLIEGGYLYIHASCVSKDGEGILLAAFPNVGKTLSVLQILNSNENFRYISDDTVLVDKKGNAYLTIFPSAIGYYDFLRFIKPNDIGKVRYYTSFIKAWLMHKSKLLNRFLKPPHIVLGELYRTTDKAKIKVVCTLEIGPKSIKKVDPEEIVWKISSINEYSLPRYYVNPFIKVYDFFNPGYIESIRKKELKNLFDFLSNCECYILACNNWDWISLLKEIGIV